MKKLIALFALVAFVGVLTAPVASATEQSNQVVLDQSFDNDQDQDKTKSKKKAKKTVVKSSAEGGCGGCGEKAECEGEVKKSEKESCCDEKVESKKTKVKKRL